MKRVRVVTLFVVGLVVIASGARTWALQAGERAGTPSETNVRYRSSYSFERCRHGWEPCRPLLARSFDVPRSSIGPLTLPAPLEVDDVIVTTPKRRGLSASFGIVTRGRGRHAPMIDVELRDEPSTRRRCDHETVADDGGQICTFLLHHAVTLIDYQRGRLRVGVVADPGHLVSEVTATSEWLPALFAVRDAVEPLASMPPTRLPSQWSA